METVVAELLDTIAKLREQLRDRDRRLTQKRSELARSEQSVRDLQRIIDEKKIGRLLNYGVSDDAAR